MLYTVFIAIPTKVEVNAGSAEEAKQIVRNQLINSKQIKPADFALITVAEEANK